MEGALSNSYVDEWESIVATSEEALRRHLTNSRTYTYACVLFIKRSSSMSGVSDISHKVCKTEDCGFDSH